MKKTKIALFVILVPVLLVGAGLVYVLRAEPLADSELPQDMSLSELSTQPLFKDLAGNEHKLFKQRRRHRKLGLIGMTARPKEVQWVPTMDAAVAKATAEDKPILLMTFVRENGNSSGDV